MEKVRVELPDDLAAFVVEVSGGALDSEEAHEYVRSVIADEMEKAERLREALRKGLDSGDSPFTVDEIFEQAAERARSRAA